MKLVIDWVWNGPWWTPLIGAIYAAVVLGIVVSPIKSCNIRINRNR